MHVYSRHCQGQTRSDGPAAQLRNGSKVSEKCPLVKIYLKLYHQCCVHLQRIYFTGFFYFLLKLTFVTRITRTH